MSRASCPCQEDGRLSYRSKVQLIAGADAGQQSKPSPGWPGFTPPQPQNAAASVAYFVTAVNSTGRRLTNALTFKPDHLMGADHSKRQ